MDIETMSVEQIERVLVAKKALEVALGKATKPKAKAKDAKAQAKGKRKPMTAAAKKALSEAAIARWKAAKKAGKKHL